MILSYFSQYIIFNQNYIINLYVIESLLLYENNRFIITCVLQTHVKDNLFAMFGQSHAWGNGCYRVIKVTQPLIVE